MSTKSLRDILEGLLFGEGEYAHLREEYLKWKENDPNIKWKELQELYRSGENPMAVIIAATYDEGMIAEVAWIYPLIIKKRLGDVPLTISSVLNADNRFFLRGPRGIGPDNIKKSAEIIKNEYNSEVEKLFLTDSSEEILGNLEKLSRIGTKKSRMLARDFAVATNYEGKLPAENWTVPFKKKWRAHGYSKLKGLEKIGIPPDVHAERVVQRLEGIEKINLHRLDQFGSEVYPEFPGLVDILLWNVGRKFCRERDPQCEKCFLNKVCQYKATHDTLRTPRPASSASS